MMSDQLPVRLKRDALSAIECCQQNAELRHLSGEGGCFQRAAYVIRKLLEHIQNHTWYAMAYAPKDDEILLFADCDDWAEPTVTLGRWNDASYFWQSIEEDGHNDPFILRPFCWKPRPSAPAEPLSVLAAPPYEAEE